MFAKTALIVLVCAAAAYAAGNPAAGAEWRWKPRHVTVSPNVMALPFRKLVETYTPQVRIPGYKTVAACGMSGASAEGRIVGGNEATPNSYPWMAALFIDNVFFCGGSIISDEYIVTAAHCLDGAAEAKVVLGAHNIRLDEDTQETYHSTDFKIHEEWSMSTVHNDIGLIRLPSPLTFTDAISPVCLPSYSAAELPVGTEVNPSGWGYPSDTDEWISDLLREVTVPIMSNEGCAEAFGDTITPDHVCIDSTGGKGTCSGDSGGPLNYVEGGMTYTRGITSFGASAGCEAGFPDGFTRLINYLTWIETNTGIIIDP